MGEPNNKVKLNQTNRSEYEFIRRSASPYFDAYGTQKSPRAAGLNWAGFEVGASDG